MSNVAATSDRHARPNPPAHSDHRANEDPSPSAVCVLPQGGERDRAALAVRRFPSGHVRWCSRRSASPETPPRSRHAPRRGLPPPQKADVAARPTAAISLHCASAAFRETLCRSSPTLRRPKFAGNPRQTLAFDSSIQLFPDEPLALWHQPYTFRLEGRSVASASAGAFARSALTLQELAKQLPTHTIEALQLHLSDRAIVARRRVDFDSREQHWELELFDARSLFEDIFSA